MRCMPMRDTPIEMHAHNMYALENRALESHALESHALESHVHKRYSYKNPFCYSTPTVSMEGSYRTETSASSKLSETYIGPLIRLWWMMLARRNFSRFRNLGFGSFCHSTLPYPVSLVAMAPTSYSNSTDLWIRLSSLSLDLVGVDPMPLDLRYSSQMRCTVETCLPTNAPPLDHR